MRPNQYIEKIVEKDTAYISLSREEKGNSLSREMAISLTDLFLKLEEAKEIRFIILDGKGTHFCLGADLNWMNSLTKLSKNEIISEALILATLFETIYNSNKLVISKIEGACYGGGIGLAVVCDFIYSTHNSTYSFGEVKVGLIPATIGSFVVNRIGVQKAKKMMLTGEKISAIEAKEMGMVDEVYHADEVENHINRLLIALRTGGFETQQKIKNFLRSFSKNYLSQQIKDESANVLAEVLASTETKEGISAFLEKRDPKWRD